MNLTDAAPDEETPAAVIGQAKMLSNKGDDAGALRLLRARRSDWPKRPPAYDAAIGRLLQRVGGPGEALAFLADAFENFPGKVPGVLRRALGMVLLEEGRTLEAGRELATLADDGGEVRQPAAQAAVDLYRAVTELEARHRDVTPNDVLHSAQRLVAEGKRPAASLLLATQRARFEDVPLRYDEQLGRLALRAGDRTTALATLTRVRDGYGDAVPPSLRAALGTVLFETGQVNEAGHELSLAVEAGAPVTRTGLLVAINSYRRGAGGIQIDTSFGNGSTFVDPAKKLVYVAIPKNASSLLKATYLLNSHHRGAYQASGASVHDFCDRLAVPEVPRGEFMGGDYFRFVVLRDPLRRLLSAYLDKFVRRRFLNRNAQGETGGALSLRAQQVMNTIRWAQEAAGVAPDLLRSITFEEFVRFLARADDAACNMHWMPQARITGTDLSLYHHVGKVERLKETLGLLTERFGYQPETSLDANLPRAASHIAKHVTHSALEAPHSALPQELDRFEENMPPPDQFYTPELKALVEARFAEDVAIYRAA